MTIVLRLLLIAAAWVVIQIGSGYLTHRMPASWFAHDRALFRCRRFERGGRLYRVVRVERWKDRLPEAGAMFAGGISKRRIVSRGVTTVDSTVLERFVAETRRAELTHWLPVAVSVTFFLWNPPHIAAWMPPIGLLGNLPFIIVQRYNRPRVEALLARRR